MDLRALETITPPRQGRGCPGACQQTMTRRSLPSCSLMTRAPPWTSTSPSQCGRWARWWMVTRLSRFQCTSLSHGLMTDSRWNISTELGRRVPQVRSSGDIHWWLPSPPKFFRTYWESSAIRCLEWYFLMHYCYTVLMWL